MRKVAVLAAIAALLAAYLVFFDRAPGEHAGGGHRRLVADFDRAGVQRITVARAGAAPFSLVRQPAGAASAWTEAPGDRAADGAAVDDLLGEIDLAETTRTADLTDAAAGLAPPEVTLALEGARGRTRIALGRPDAGDGVFARVGAAPAIRVAPRRLLELADRGPDAFRDRRLVPYAAGDVARLGWQPPGGAARALVRDGARWKNDAQRWVAGPRVEEALRRLGALRATRYLAAAPAGDGARVEVTAGGAQASLRAGVAGCAAGQTAVAAGAGEGACVETEAWDGLLRALEAARAPDRRLVSAPPADVERIELAEGAARLVLVRTSGESWSLQAPKASYLVDPKMVDDWLAALGRVDAPPSAPPPGAEVRHLVVVGRYREAADLAPGAAGYALLAPDPLRFRDRAVLDFAHFDARTLRRTGGGRTIALASRDGEDWRAVSPSGAAVEGTNVARVVGTLGNLRAEAFQASAPAGAPTLTLEVSVQPPGESQPTRHTVALYGIAAPKTKEAPGCAGRLDREVSFTLPAAACEELRLPLVK
ncbi:MAG TPA: DUF4340 domain-containing protein [Polyangia bacterium]|nr:DUF4340 domain-containing protein [Polyangia bacterium]